MKNRFVMIRQHTLGNRRVTQGILVVALLALSYVGWTASRLLGDVCVALDKVTNGMFVP